LILSQFFVSPYTTLRMRYMPQRSGPGLIIGFFPAVCHRSICMEEFKNGVWKRLVIGSTSRLWLWPDFLSSSLDCARIIGSRPLQTPAKPELFVWKVKHNAFYKNWSGQLFLYGIQIRA
jgi:hypothetical protein